MKLFILAITTIAVIAALLTTTATALTNTRAPMLTPLEIFQKIDTDNSGFISIQEGKAYLTKLGANANQLDEIVKEIWAKEDSNKDGMVSWEEWEKLNAPAINEHNRRGAADHPAATATTPTATTPPPPPPPPANAEY